MDFFDGLTRQFHLGYNQEKAFLERKLIRPEKRAKKLDSKMTLNETGGLENENAVCQTFSNDRKDELKGKEGDLKMENFIDLDGDNVLELKEESISSFNKATEIWVTKKRQKDKEGPKLTSLYKMNGIFFLNHNLSKIS
jgi:hypothetical protein